MKLGIIILLTVFAVILLLLFIPVKVEIKAAYSNKSFYYYVKVFNKKINIKFRHKKKLPALTLSDAGKIIKYINFNNFRWDVLCGCDDAAYDVAIVQSLRNISYFIHSALVLKSDKTKIQINIIPAFNQNIFKTDIFCILTFKTGYIIYAAAKIILKAKAKNN